MNAEDTLFLASQLEEQHCRRVQHIIKEYLMLPTDKQMQVAQAIAKGTFNLDLVMP